MVCMDLEPIALPAPPAAPRRPSVPILAAIVPIGAGVVLWLITGSLLALCFAALGPLMLIASLLDGVRTRRRDRREADVAHREGWERAERDLERRHEQERAALRRSHPDVAACLVEPPLRDLQPVDEATPVVLGAGEVASSVRISGGEGESARAFRERGARLTGAPIAVPMGRGMCIRAPSPVAFAVARAIAVQLCLRHAPSQLALVGPGVAALGLDGFPHARRARPGAWRVAVVIGADAERTEASAQLRVCAPGADVPEGVTTVLDFTDPRDARVRAASGVERVELECLSRAQTLAVAELSSGREEEVGVLPDAVALGELRDGGGDGLSAAIGRGSDAVLSVDLVEDGPHAIVTGMTGSGKSELLVTWITAMAQHHGPHEVVFVLADFKGGTAFDPLRGLPHVAAVMTDLDEEGARRGVESLTAELRRREGVLAAAGARSIADPQVELPRLVIVVDEFAALLQEHTDLGAVFVDVAARGRALGMHLILGTQRASGVIRDALAANCPLRVSLRVSDPADSRLVIGSDEAAEIPGGAGSRGLAFIRRPQDTVPQPVRVALTAAADLRRVAARWADAAQAVSPWLPPLPQRLPLEALGEQDGALILGRADEPDRQRQPLVTVRPGVDRGIAVIGGSGSGRSSAIRLLAAQAPDALIIEPDAERAWDAVQQLSDPASAAPSLVLCDDLDQIAAMLPAEYAQALLEQVEQFVRSATARGCSIVLTAGRISGQLTRIVDALPMRLLLRTGTRMEHLAAGGDSDGYRRDRPPGRAHWSGREMQLAWVEETAILATPGGRSVAEERWTPGADLVGVVGVGIRRTAEALRVAHPDCDVVPLGEQRVQASSRESPTLFVGDADSWQRQWELCQRVRADGELLIVAEAAPALRSLAGIRELPPFARVGAGRAWSIRDGHPPRRVTLGGLDPSRR